MSNMRSDLQRIAERAMRARGLLPGLSPEEMAEAHHARTNTRSVYTDARIFPTLPERLSTNLTSLNEGQR
jgi:hypothetical protein